MKRQRFTLKIKDIDNIFANKEEYYFLFFAILLVFIIFFRYIFGNYVYIFNDIGSDTITLFYPNYVHINQFIRDWGIPFWSFHQGLGQNVFTSVYVDPFNLLYLIFDKSLIPHLIIYVEILKILLTGFIFCKYLRMLGILPVFIIIGGLFFSFSSYFLIGGTWYIFSTQAFYLAFLLYSFEIYYQKKKILLLPISFALIAANESFLLLHYSVFIFIYFNIRFFETTPKLHKSYIKLMIGLILSAVIGLGISAVFFLNKFHLMINSPRGSGDFSLSDTLIQLPVFYFENLEHYLTIFLRYLPGDLLGVGSDFKGWGNYLEAPMLYCGLLTLILIPNLLFIRDNRTKFIYFGVLVLLSIFLIFPYFRNLFWLFTGSYFRFLSLIIVFSLVYIAFKSFNLSNFHNIITKYIFFLVPSIISIAFLILIGLSEAPNFDYFKLLLIFLFLLLYSVGLFLLFKTKSKAYQILIFAIVLLEIAFFSTISMNQRISFEKEYFKPNQDYYDNLQNAINTIKQKDKSQFSRIETDSLQRYYMQSSLNLAMLLGYYGTSSYNSFNNKYYVEFLSALRLVKTRKESESRWLNGFIGRPPLQIIFGVKYIVISRPEIIESYKKFHYLPYINLGNLIILKNDNAIQLGYPYNQIISIADFKKLDYANKLLVLTKAVVLNDDKMNKIAYDMQILHDQQNLLTIPIRLFLDNLNEKCNESFTIEEFNHSYIKGKIYSNEKQIMFFSIPYDKGWSVYINGKKAEALLVNISFLGCTIGKGESIIELKYIPPFFWIGLITSIICLIIYFIYLKFSQNNPLI